MAYRNLKAEMARKDITIEAISKEIGVHRNSVSNKVKWYLLTLAIGAVFGLVASQIGL